MRRSQSQGIRIPAMVFACVAALAALLWWAYYERYHTHADCIDELTNSSCITPDGNNVTSGGILWGVLALPVTFAAAALLCMIVLRLVRRRLHGVI